MRKLTKGERELINEIITNYPLYKEKLADCQAKLAVFYNVMKTANDAGSMGGGGRGAISDPTADASFRKIRLEMDLAYYRDYTESTEKVLNVYMNNSEMMTLVRTKYWSGQFDWERDRNMESLIEVLGYTSNERRFYALLNSFRWKIGFMHGVLR